MEVQYQLYHKKSLQEDDNLEESIQFQSSHHRNVRNLFPVHQICSGAIIYCMKQLPNQGGAVGLGESAKGSIKDNLTGALYKLLTCTTTNWLTYPKIQEKQAEFKFCQKLSKKQNHQ